MQATKNKKRCFLVIFLLFFCYFFATPEIAGKSPANRRRKKSRGGVCIDFQLKQCSGASREIAGKSPAKKIKKNKKNKKNHVVVFSFFFCTVFVLVFFCYLFAIFLLQKSTFYKSWAYSTSSRVNQFGSVAKIVQ